MQVSIESADLVWAGSGGFFEYKGIEMGFADRTGINRYTVTVPGWSEGKPLNVNNVPGYTPHDAYRTVLDWVNTLWGERSTRYDSLPVDTIVRKTN